MIHRTTDCNYVVNVQLIEVIYLKCACRSKVTISFVVHCNIILAAFLNFAVCSKLVDSRRILSVRLAFTLYYVDGRKEDTKPTIL